ncbi:MAG: hypothetical protein PVF33_10880, partial [Candidatus Latescibacterota bacterium]
MASNVKTILITLICVSLSGGIVSCTDTPTIAEWQNEAPDVSMERVRGNVTNQLLNDVWCSTDGELFAVGMCRTVLYKNNAELTLMDCPDGDVLGYHLNGVWGAG